MRQFERSGQFWTLDHPERLLWGRLSYDPGGTTNLTLDGSIADAPYIGNLSFPEIHGQLSDGVPCVLRDVWGDVESFIAHTRTSRSLLQSELFLLGLDRDISAADRFVRSTVRLSHLNDWFGRPLTLEYQKGSFDECLVKFEPDRTKARGELDAVSFELHAFCARTIPTLPDSRGAEFTYEYKLVVNPDLAQPVAWHLRVASLLREFFMFLIGSGVYTLDLRLYPPGGPQAGEVAVFPRVTVPMVVRLEPKYFYSSHRKLKEEFAGLFARWTQEQGRMVVVRHALSDLLTVDGASPEAVFTRVVQTMEHFHGLVSADEGRYVRESTWRRFTTLVESCFPDRWAEGNFSEQLELFLQKTPLLGRIKGVNTVSFRTRLRALFDAVPLRELYPIIENPPDAVMYLNSLMPRLESTRNYLTHFNEKDGTQAFTGDDLETTTLQCWAVLIYSLARHLGLGEELAGDLALAARRTMFLVGTKTAL